MTRERRSEIYIHCYRMLGSLSDAEDLTQETFTRAWRSRKELANPAAARSWLFRIATNACLDALRGRRRKRQLWRDSDPAPAGVDLGIPDLNIDWLEPVPDSFFAEVPDERPGPEPAYELSETVRLAFLSSVQRLPARQRAIFLMREVLGWSATEVASTLEITPQAGNSLLQRARRTFNEQYQAEPKWAAASEQDQELAEKYAAALERRDLEAFTSLLISDAALHMPPWRLWFSGRDAIGQLVTQIFQIYSGFRVRIFRANGCSAVAVYNRTAESDNWQPHAVHVIETAKGAVSSIVAYVGPLGESLFCKMGLPLNAPESRY